MNSLRTPPVSNAMPRSLPRSCRSICSTIVSINASSKASLRRACRSSSASCGKCTECIACLSEMRLNSDRTLRGRVSCIMPVPQASSAARTAFLTTLCVNPRTRGYTGSTPGSVSENTARTNLAPCFLSIKPRMYPPGSRGMFRCIKL